jgi:NADH:ubiquinone oxidoreductase subunit H
MPEANDNGKVKELAGGWITERAGTPVPLFLKLTYVGFSIFGLVYLFLFRSGETTQASRGPLVLEQAASTDPTSFVWVVILGAILVAYVAWLFVAGFGKVSDEE